MCICRHIHIYYIYTHTHTYLANMQVRGTLVLAVMVKEHLWGLVVCHDPQPRSVAYQTRMACEFLAQVLEHA